MLLANQGTQLGGPMGGSGMMNPRKAMIIQRLRQAGIPPALAKAAFQQGGPQAVKNLVASAGIQPGLAQGGLNNGLQLGGIQPNLGNGLNVLA